MRRSARVDVNQPEIVKALRGIGATVTPLHAVGGGVPDLLVGYRGRTILLEVKNKPRIDAHGKDKHTGTELTPKQVEWHGKWLGRPVPLVHDIDEALAAVQ